MAQSLKMLHTADWHLGKTLEGYSRLPEQRAVLTELCELAEHEAVDLVLIAGDVFDSYNHQAEAEALYYRTLKRLSQDGQRPVLVVGGNHDHQRRLESSQPLAKEMGILTVTHWHTTPPAFDLPAGPRVTQTARGFVELALPQQDFPVRVILTPFVNLPRIRAEWSQEAETLRAVLAEHWQQLAEQYCDQRGVNLLLSHLFVQPDAAHAPHEADSERFVNVGGAQVIYSQDFPEALDYVALGHLHLHQTIATAPCPIVYSASPLAYRYTENGAPKHAVIVEARPGQPVDYRPVPLQSGRPVLTSPVLASVEAAEAWLRDHPEAYVALQLRVPAGFLRNSDRQRLLQAHDRLLHLIPIADTAAEEAPGGMDEAQLAQMSTRAIFRQFYEHERGSPPSDELMALFDELLAQRGDTEAPPPPSSADASDDTA